MLFAALLALATPALADGPTHAFRIGALPAIALKDGDLVAPNDGRSAFLGDPRQIGAALAADGLRPDRFNLSIQPLLVIAGPRALLFDTGASATMGPGAGKLPMALRAAGIDPARVTDIFISHAHADHVGGLLTPDGVPIYLGARVHMAKAEWAWLAGMGEAAAEQQGLQHYPALIAYLRAHVAPFDPGAILIPGVVAAVPIAGHTPGHSAYRIGAGRDTLLDIGDALHSHVVSVEMPDILNLYDQDKPLAAHSRETLLAHLAASHERVYAGHFPYPGIGTIGRRDGHYVWQPER